MSALPGYDYWKTNDFDGERRDAEAERISEKVNAAISAMTFGEKRDECNAWKWAMSPNNPFRRLKVAVPFRDWLADRLRCQAEAAIAGDRQDAADAAAESRREMEWDS